MYTSRPLETTIAQQLCRKSTRNMLVKDSFIWGPSYIPTCLQVSELPLMERTLRKRWISFKNEVVLSTFSFINVISIHNYKFVN